MNTKRIIAGIALLATLSVSAQEIVDDKTPTMGWSSWNTFGLNINETLIKSQASAMRTQGYMKAGYKYINIDDGYFGGRDENGHLLIHPTRFPRGLKPVVEYIHKLGLKAGIYSDGGKNTCGSMFGGDATGIGVGFYGHDQEDCDFFFKELGFDFIKVDFCGGSPYHNSEGLSLPEKDRYTAIRKAIENTGRTDVRMNICRWAFPGTWVYNVGTSWRTTGDINCSWGSVRDIIKENLYLSAYAIDGCYNDMDMLEVGRGLSVEEDKTHFGMWCIMASPLLIGCNLSSINATAKALLKNTDLIALNQDCLHLQAYVVQHKGDTYILAKDIEQYQSPIRAIAMYNPTDEATTMTLDFKEVELAGIVKVRDLFEQQDLDPVEGSMTINVPAHGCRIYRLEAEQRLERTLYEAETAYLSAYQELTNNQSARSAIYEDAEYCSGREKVGWLGYSDGNDLQWRHVYSKEGGNYKLTIDCVCGESRNLYVKVNNGKEKRFSVNTRGWSTVGSVTMNVELAPGDNVVRLYNKSAWMPDVDCMHLEFISPLGISQLEATDKKNKIYTINGIDVSNQKVAEKGIYIIDGKKVMVK